MPAVFWKLTLGRLQIAKDWEELFEKILDTLDEILSSLPRIDAYSTKFLKSKAGLFRESITSYYRDIIAFGIEAFKLYRCSTKRRSHFRWPLFLFFYFFILGVIVGAPWPYWPAVSGSTRRPLPRTYPAPKRISQAAYNYTTAAAHFSGERLGAGEYLFSFCLKSHILALLAPHVTMVSRCKFSQPGFSDGTF